ncbi:MAG: GNAT family N-acetyltransferase [Planctomycetota bacterium]|jgi:GNAT superfamily N-acetyltransferase
MTIRIATFSSEHVEEAAELFRRRYALQRELVPALPDRHLDTKRLIPRLEKLSAETYGVAALRGGELAGYLLAAVIPSFRGHRAAYSPEWANGAEPDGGGAVHREMYARISDQWLADGCVTHLLTVFENENSVLDAYFWSGFGLVAMDGLRDLRPVATGAASLEIRQAGPEDLGEVMRLERELRAYLARPPILLPPGDDLSHDELLGRYDDAQFPVWLAFQGGEAVALLGLRPPDPHACYVIRDEATVAVARAFVREEDRCSGIGTALLATVVDWARSNGFARLAVDCEPQNVEGSRFWLAHFEPICRSVMRRTG